MLLHISLQGEHFQPESESYLGNIAAHTIAVPGWKYSLRILYVYVLNNLMPAAHVWVRI